MVDAKRGLRSQLVADLPQAILAPLEPSSTACHQCGIDNEIVVGLYDRPTIILGQVQRLVL